MNEWRIDYDSDTGPNDGGFWEWWDVTNDKTTFRAHTDEDAQRLWSLLTACWEPRWLPPPPTKEEA